MRVSQGTSATKTHGWLWCKSVLPEYNCVAVLKRCTTRIEPTRGHQGAAGRTGNNQACTCTGLLLARCCITFVTICASVFPKQSHMTDCCPHSACALHRYASDTLQCAARPAAKSAHDTAIRAAGKACSCSRALNTGKRSAEDDNNACKDSAGPASALLRTLKAERSMQGVVLFCTLKATLGNARPAARPTARRLTLHFLPLPLPLPLPSSFLSPLPPLLRLGQSGARSRLTLGSGHFELWCPSFKQLMQRPAF